MLVQLPPGVLTQLTKLPNSLIYRSFILVHQDGIVPPGPAGTSHPEWIKIKLRKIKEFGSLHAAPADLQLHQVWANAAEARELVEF